MNPFHCTFTASIRTGIFFASIVVLVQANPQPDTSTLEKNEPSSQKQSPPATGASAPVMRGIPKEDPRILLPVVGQSPNCNDRQNLGQECTADSRSANRELRDGVGLVALTFHASWYFEDAYIRKKENAQGASFLLDLYLFQKTQVWQTENSLIVTGGNAGLSGEFSTLGRYGYRLQFGRSHGVVLAGGLHLHAEGTSRFWYSGISVFDTRLGWLYLANGNHVALGAIASPTLVGRWRVGDNVNHRTGETLFWGAFVETGHAHASRHYGGVGYVIRAQAQHQVAPFYEAKTSVNILSARACLAAMVLFCVDSKYWYESYPIAFSYSEKTSASSRYLGLTVGFGGVFANPQPDTSDLILSHAPE